MLPFFLLKGVLEEAEEPSLAVKVDSLHIGEVTAFSIEEADQFFHRLQLSEKDMKIANLIL
ncbi:hypothetical protein, partial [Rossellomorea arthrocnemi]|uniref:hypothetical protein n=1 Tax=Rossellomorea arthrocnemi TaxID=2769542 RepID=UPI0038B5115B